MAKIVNISFKDDWTEKVIAEGDHEIVMLEVEGQWYEWDLAGETKVMFLEEILGPWLRSGRKITAPNMKSARARANAAAAGNGHYRPSAAPTGALRPGIKDWAVKQGLLSEEQRARGGRISRAIEQAYDQMLEEKQRAQQPWGKNIPR